LASISGLSTNKVLQQKKCWIYACVVELENAVKDMPSKVDVENLRGELNSLNKQMDSVQHGVRRIEQWLIDNKK
jgi:hypothetical protein